MPPVIFQAAVLLSKIGFAVAGAVGATGLTAALGTYGGLMVGAAVVVGGALVAKKAMSLFEIDIPTVDTDASRQRTVKSTTEPQKIIYGEALVSGPVSFVALSGTDNEDFYQTIVLAGHKLNNITDIHMDDLVIPNADINSGNAAGGQVGGSGPFGFKNSSAICTINKHQGDASQTADSLLTPLTDYTTSHRGDGIAYLAMKWTLNEHSAKTWEKYSPQNVKALVQGKSIYDPRLDVTAGNDAGANPTNASYIAYSTNPALCLADYLMDATLGMGISAAKIDWAAIITAANGCDVSVSVPGGTEARFSCNGVIFATDKHQKNINKILSSMNGSLVYSNGKYILHAGIYEEPTESLNEDDLIGAISIKTSLERSDRFNTIKGLFVDPSQNHKSSEFPKVQLADAVTRDNGEVLEKEVQYPMTNSSYGAQRLSHKLIQLSDQQKIITFPANLSALRIAAGDRVQVSIDELSWTNKVFQCVDWTFSEQGGVNLTLREDSSTSYADPTVTPTNEYSTITASGSITDAFRGVPSPSGLRAASGEGKVFLNWVNPGRPADYATIEVFSSSTNNVNNAVKIGDTDGTQFVHDGNNAADSIAVGNDRHYWIRSKKNVGTTVSEVSVYEPNNPTSGVSVTVLATAVNWSNVANPTIGVDLNADDTITIDLGDATASTSGNAVANSGLNSGGLTMNTGGSIKGGQSAYNSGTGFFLGYDSGYKFSIGNSSTQALTFDGSNLSVTGNITATSGTFTGTVNANAGAFTGDVSTGSKFTAGSSNDIAVMDGGNALYRFYAGNSVPESAAFRVDKDGHIDAANIRVYDENGQVILDATGLHGVGLGNISANSGVGVSEVAGRLDNNADEITFTTGASSETYTFEPKVQIDINQAGESGENPNTSNLSFAAASESAVTTMIGQVKLIVEYFVKASGGSYSGTPTATEEFTFVSGTSATSSQFGVNVLTINSRGVGIIYADIGAAEAISDPSIAGARTFVRSSKNLTFSSAGTYNVKVNARIATLAGTTLTTSTTPALDSSLSGTGVILGTDETQSSLEDFRRLYAIKPASGNTRTIIASSTEDTFVSTSGSSLLNTGGTISGDLVITGDLTVQGTTTTINVADLTVADKDITLNYSTGDSSSTANNAGIIIQDAVNSTTDATLLWKTATDTFEFSHPIKAQSDLTLSSSGGDAGIYWKDSSASDATAWHLHADVTQATSNMYLNYAGGGTGFSFVNNGNFLASGTIFADGAASNSLQWEAGYDYSQVGHLPLAGGNLTGNVRFGNTSVGTEDDSEYLLSTGGQLIIRANDSADDASYTNLILDSGKAGGTETNSAGVVTRTNNVNRMRVDGLGGISFFEDTGTTAKMVWSPTSEELQFADNVKATFGAGPEIEIYSNGAVGYIDTAQLIIANAAHTNNIAKFIQGGAVELYYSNNLRLSTSATGIQVTGNIANASGDMTVDSAGGLILDAATGVISLHEAGNGVFGTLTRASGSLAIKSEVSDADILFKGSDSGSQITALTLDMSNGGAATFNSSVTSTGLISGSLLNPANNSLTILGGGSATNNGANLTMYGGSASASAGDFRFRNGTTETARITAAGAATFSSSLTVDGVLTKIGGGNSSQTVGLVVDHGSSTAYNLIQAENDNGTWFSVAGSGAATFNSSVQTGGLVDVRTSHTSTDVTAANSNTTLRLLNSGSGNGIYNAIKFSGNQQDMYIMSFNNATQADRRLGFFVGSTAGDAATDERLSITGDGNVSIGNTAAATRLHVKSSGGVGTSSTFETDAPSSAINFVNTGSSTNAYLGSVGTSLFFATNNTERMRLDASGTLLVGKTASSSATAGIELTYNNIIIGTRDGDTAQYLNRLSSDGEILGLQRDGTTVGSVGTFGSTTYFAGNSHGFLINGTAIEPSNNNGGRLNNAVDVGSSTYRFKDLWLSGIAYVDSWIRFGGAANYYVHSDNANYLRFGTAGSERARITSDGKFGLGLTNPSANIHIYSSGQAIARVEGANEYYSGLMIRNNHSSTQSQWHVAAAGGTSGWGAVNGNFIIRDDTTNSTGIEIERGAGGATGALYIDASGNVGISVTPSAFVLPDGSSGALQLQSGGMVSAYNGVTHLSQNWYFNSGEKYIANGSASRLVMSGADYIWQSAGNNTSGAGAALTWSESMRLSGGTLLVGCTSAPTGSTGGSGFITESVGRKTLKIASTTTGGAGLAEFINPNGIVGSISTTGSTTSYNTSSDQRLKDKIVDAPSASDDIDAIRVRSFDWKADGSHQKYGMIAQELIEVAPEAVSAPEDPDEMMGVDYSKLVPMLIKEIQQLRKRVQDLEED